MSKPWSISEEQFIAKSAGIITVVEMASILGRSYESTRSHIKTMKKDGRLNRSMTIERDTEYISDLEECCECHTLRATCDKDGVCKVCHATERLATNKARMERAYWNLPYELRERTRCEFDIRRNPERITKEFQKPKKPTVNELDDFYAAKAMDDYYRSLEQYELRLLQLDIDAFKQRTSKWRRKAAKWRKQSQ